MITFFKKPVTALFAIAVVAMIAVPGVSSAKTVEEMQNQLAALAAQLNQLFAQVGKIGVAPDAGGAFEAKQLITVVSPNGGEQWRQGASQVIRWRSSGLPSGSRVIASMESFDPRGFIAAPNTVAINQGSATIKNIDPNLAPAGNNYKARVFVIHPSGAVYTDQSDGYFSVAVAPVAPTSSITVILPNGGERWISGESHTIRWSTTDFKQTDTVQIEVWDSRRNCPTNDPGCLRGGDVIVSSAPNTGSYSWNTILSPLAAFYGPTTQAVYKLRLTAKEYPPTETSKVKDDWSDNYFTLTLPYGQMPVAPSISSVSLSSVPSDGITTETLHGSGFNHSTAVYFSGPDYRYAYKTIPSSVSPDGQSLTFVLSKNFPPPAQYQMTVSNDGVTMSNTISLNVTIPASCATNQTWNGSACVQTSENMKLLVLLTKFQNTTNEPYSKSYMQGQVFTNSNSVKNFYEKVSYNKMSVTGDVFGWYTIPDVTDRSCNKKKWMDDAEIVAQQNGVNLSQYTHIIVTFPSGDQTASGCQLTGEAYPFDVHPRAYVFATDASIIIHELGHTLGMGHSNGLDCGQHIIKDNYHSICTIKEYYDPFDFMGLGETSGTRTSNFNAPNRVGMGWLLPSNVQLVATSGTFEINTLETPSTAVQVLKIKKPDSEASYPNTRNDYYYIDYSPDLEYDYSKNVDGVTIRIYNQDRGFGTLMLDMTPKSCIPSPLPGGCRLHSDWNDGMLKDGMTFVDNNGIRITQISHTNTKAIVTVVLPTP